MMSDMSKNLFNRAILFSGSAFNPWVFPPDLGFANRLGRALGFSGTSEAQLLEFLENAKASDLVLGIFALTTPEERYGSYLDIVFGPVVEPSWSKNPFLNKDPVIAARTAWSNKIDVIFNVNSFEGLFLAVKERFDDVNLFVDTMNSNPAYFAPLTALKMDPSSQDAKVYGKKIKDLYFNQSLSRENLLQFYKVQFLLISINFFVKLTNVQISSFPITRSTKVTTVLFNLD